MTKLEQSLKDRDLIDIGDKVTVQHHMGYFDGVVKCKPRDVGDCWIFEEENGNITYLQNFIYIRKNKEIKNSDGSVPF